MTRGRQNGAASAIISAKKKRPSAKHKQVLLPAHHDKGLAGRPEWEAMKSHCGNLEPAEAVRRGVFLSAQYRRMKSMPAIDFKKIIITLQAKKIPFVLTGAHGISTWTGRPRSTHDVDILVKSGRNYARAVKAMQLLYPDLEVRSLAGVAAFFVKGEMESVIDVTYPHRPDIGETLATAIWVEDQGLKYRIPALEAALANKYGAALSVGRDPGKRIQDLADFYFMVKHSLDKGRAPINLEELAALGEKVWPGGGKEILYFVEQAKAGQIVNPLVRLNLGS